MAGRKRKCTPTIMRKIAERLAEGETLIDICKDPDVPSYRAITDAVLADEEVYEIYRRGRVLQGEYYADVINSLARSPLPDVDDQRKLHAEVNRRKLEIETLKWTTSRAQPHGVRDRKEDAPQQQAITISWAGGDVDVSADGA